MAFLPGKQVAVLSPNNPLPRVMAGPLTVAAEYQKDGKQSYILSNGSVVPEILLRPWVKNTVIGEFIPGYVPVKALGGQFSVGQIVALKDAPNEMLIIIGGPYLHNGRAHYETNNGKILRDESQLMHIEDAITLDHIKAGNEMVNLQGSQGLESQFGRYYKKSTFDEIANIPSMLVPYLTAKKNPPRDQLSPKNIRQYRATGGRKKTRRYRKK